MSLTERATDSTENYCIREVVPEDLAKLLALEKSCFDTDRLSRRRFIYWINAQHRLFLVAEDGDRLLGYGLVLLHKGTRLARYYSLAISKEVRHCGLGRQISERLEQLAAEQGRLFMRLEVSTTNTAAQRLYESLGYSAFGVYTEYYDDHSDALRMQKRIRRLGAKTKVAPIPWLRQTTPFTCGPASLQMAMCRIDTHLQPSQELELDIWRQATTIFMTSGHGGCHPLGLALAARHMGFAASVTLNKQGPLFIESVRSEEKRNILAVVDRQFNDRVAALGIPVAYEDVTLDQIEEWLQKKWGVIILISTYRMDGKKSPHWVTVTGMDELCLYVHDPDPDTLTRQPMDCQHIPIARDDFTKMSVFGSERLRAAVVITGRA